VALFEPETPPAPAPAPSAHNDERW
jgi:hypothetical protein